MFFIPYFIEFQYGILNENVQTHKSVIEKLKKYNLLKKYEQFMKSSTTLKNKNKDEDMDKVIKKEKFLDSMS